jgi:hypothetical protein
VDAWADYRSNILSDNAGREQPGWQRGLNALAWLRQGSRLEVMSVHRTLKLHSLPSFSRSIADAERAVCLNAIGIAAACYMERSVKLDMESIGS